MADFYGKGVNDELFSILESETCICRHFCHLVVIKKDPTNKRSFCLVFIKSQGSVLGSSGQIRTGAILIFASSSHIILFWFVAGATCFITWVKELKVLNENPTRLVKRIR